MLAEWRTRVAALGAHAKPVLQPLYVDLSVDPDEVARPIHPGFRSGAHALIRYIRALRSIGMHHVALNLRFNRAAIEPRLERPVETVLPEFDT